jgi:hypothetical protein
MKKLFLSLMLLLSITLCHAQDFNASINRNWFVLAEDTNLTYRQITHLCDSLFADAGFFAVDTTTDTAEQEESKSLDGSSFREYSLWKMFWYSRCDSNGKLHNIYADALAAVSAQQKTTSAPSSCCGGSPVQSDPTKFPHTPRGWKFIGPQGIVRDDTTTSIGTYNDLNMYLGRIEEISVNPANRNEVYASDPFGGLWYSSNAETAPNNTWTCLSDRLPFVPGTGITEYYVDFSTTPHQIYALASVSYRPSIPNITDAMPKTVGIFHSGNNGATFSLVNVSSAIDFSQDPVLDMKYWSGTAGKFLFLATRSRIFRVNVTSSSTTPSAIDTIVKFSDYLTATGEASDNAAERFRGFAELAFLPSDPTYMFVTTRSNVGYGSFPSTSGLYRVSNSHVCTSCTLTAMKPNRTGDYLSNLGEFVELDFPAKYPGWRRKENPLPAANWWEISTSSYAKCDPSSTPGVFSSLEVPVAGSFFEHVTYAIEFQLELPDKTEVQVVLKDVKNAYQGVADWGNAGFRSAYSVGAGIGGTPGVYRNTTGSTIILGATLYTDTITATDYVDRLEFAATSLTGYSGGTIKLDKIKVTQAYSNRVTDMVVSSADNVLCIVDDNTAAGSFSLAMQKLDGTSPSTSPTTYTAGCDGLALSAVSSDSIYQYFRQSGPAAIYRRSLSTSGSTVITGSTVAAYVIHDDVRAVTALADSMTGNDILYVGCDGGIAKRTATGIWVNLNGTGLNTSWTTDIGSNIFSGEVGLAASDCHWMWSEAGKRDRWIVSAEKNDGAQMMYGKRQETKNARFYGRSGNGKFMTIGVESTLNPPVVARKEKPIYQSVMSKAVATYGGEFFGEGGMRDPQSKFNPIFKVTIDSGLGTTASPYFFDLNDSITQDTTYIPADSISVGKVLPVQALAPDLYDPNYLLSYHTNGPGTKGYFARANTSDGFATQPTWQIFKNRINKPLMTVVCDPRSSGATKRLWAGVAGYGTAGDGRVYMTNNDAVSWDPMSTGLPSGPVNILVYDEQSRYLFAGTDQGIYSYDVGKNDITGAEQWKCYSLNLPNAYVTDLDINHCTGKIYAGFYGRGVYEADLPPQYNVGGAATTDYTDQCNFLAISSSIAWTGERFEFRSIYIPAGVTLTLDSCTVNMAKDKYIIVAKGGQLIVNKSKLTNACGQIWGGIMAKGDPYLPQTPANQGWVVIQNNSVIEYARNAVSNCDVVNDDSIFAWNSGGVVRAENSTFRNSLQSVTFYPYHNVTSSVTAPNYSAFSRCNFEWNIDNRAAKLGYTAGSHARLIDVEAVKFYGCNFLNRDTATAIKGRGTGIHIVNAGAHVLPTSILYLPHYSVPRFCGFENGIMAQGNGGSQLLAVRSAQFDSNSVGINISKHDNLSATGCSFKIGNGLPVQVVYGKPSSFIGCKQNIGILAAATPAFTIENNIFSGRVNASSLWYNLGAVVVNSSYNSKRVYGNRFDTLTFGVAAMGDNRPPTGGIGGLTVVCNHFQDNNTDLFIGRQNGIVPDNQGITAGLPSVPFGVAGNKFYNSTTNIVNNGAPLYYTYSSVSSNEAPLTVTGSAPTIVSSIATPSGCTSSGVILSGTSPDGAMHGGFLTSPKTAYQSNISTYQAAMGILAGRMDNGNRAELAAYMDTVSNGDSLYAVLQSGSPYLSNATLEQMIDRGVMSYGQEYEVLVANPDAVRKEGLYHDVVAYFEDAYANSSPPIPDYATMLASHIDDTTTRTWLEDTVFSARVQADEQLNLIVAGLRAPVDTNLGVNDTTGSNICMDTTSMYYLQDSNARFLGFDSVDTWLQKMVSPFAVYDRIAFQYNRGNFAAAHTIFTGIAVGALTGLERETYDTFAHVWSVLKAASDSGRKYYWLTESERAMLYYDESKPLASSNAAREIIKNVKTLTPPVYELDWNCGEAPRPGGTKRVKRFTIKSSASTKGWVKVYPNPSEGLVTFDYGKVNRSGGSDISMVVMNVLGEKVFEQTIKNDMGRLVWDSKKLPSGAYIFQFSDEGGVFGSGKVVLVK